MHLFLLPFFLRPHILAFCPQTKTIYSHILSKDESYSDGITSLSLDAIPTSFWYASGPAPFTGLRNMSVFLKTLRLVHPSCSFFSFSTSEYLAQCFPESEVQVFSAGKKECFVCTKNSIQLTKNSIFLESIQKAPQPIGVFPESCHENFYTSLSTPPFSEHICSPQPFLQTLNSFINNASAYHTNDININYGALPRLGIKKD